MTLKTSNIDGAYVCPICGCNSGGAVGAVDYGQSYVLYKCGECGVIFKDIATFSRVAIQDVQEGIYTQQYMQSMRHNKRQWERFAKDRLDIILNYKKKGRLLEIGCAAGHFLDLASKNGFDVTGIDASLLLVNEAKKRDLNVKCGRIEDDLLPKRHFDIIVMFHLIEHIDNLCSFIANMRGLLRNDGVIIVITPNADSCTDKIFGWKHPKYTIEDHLYCFSPQSIQYPFMCKDFEIVDILSKEYCHQFGTSLIGYIKLYLTRLIACKKRGKKTIGDKSNAFPESNVLGWCKSFARYILWKCPYVMGYVMYPILKPYGCFVERKIKGSELVVVLRTIGKKCNERQQD